MAMGCFASHETVCTYEGERSGLDPTVTVDSLSSEDREVLCAWSRSLYPEGGVELPCHIPTPAIGGSAVSLSMGPTCPSDESSFGHLTVRAWETCEGWQATAVERGVVSGEHCALSRWDVALSD